jgi:LPXTG-motif cell wall-anchored protein
MKKSLTVVVAVTLTTSFLMIAAPASADDFSTDHIGFTDGTAGRFGGSIISGGFAYDGAFSEQWQGLGGNHAFDTGMQAGFYNGAGSPEAVPCASPAQLDPAGDDSGDQILLCDSSSVTTDVGTLDVAQEYRFFADGQTVRLRLIITNSGGTPVPGARFFIFDDYYQDGGLSVSASTSAGLSLAAWPAISTTVLNGADLHYVTDDRTNSYSCPVVATLSGTAGATVVPTYYGQPGQTTSPLGAGASLVDANYSLPTVDPGQTVEIAYFTKVFSWGTNGDDWSTNTRAAVNAAWADTSFRSASAALAAGIPDPTRVLNFVFSADTTTETSAETAALAATGGDPSWSLALASVLGLLGTALVIGRRRRKV